MSIINNTTSPAIRTGIQGVIAEGCIRLVETVPDPDLAISTGDRGIMLVLGTALVSLIQNAIENKMDRSILIPQRTDPLMPESAPE